MSALHSNHSAMDADVKGEDVDATRPSSSRPGRRLSLLRVCGGVFSACLRRQSRVPLVGLEPTRQGHQFLKLARLPFRHKGMF